MTNGVSPDQTPIDPKRVKAFARFFKSYMSVSSLVVASLPIPVTSFGLIPTFSAQTKLLSVYASLFCFLILGFIFYGRHRLARWMFPEYFDRDQLDYVLRTAFPATTPGEIAERVRGEKRKHRRRARRRTAITVLPLVLIAASLVSVFQYNDVLILNVREIAVARGSRADDTSKTILQQTDLNGIKYSSRLMILYLAIFLTAEAAFVIMAIKEYLQDLVGLTEMDLIRGYKEIVEAPGGSKEIAEASAG